MLARVSGAYRKTQVYARVSGALMPVRNVYARVGGSWRPAWLYFWETGGWGGCSASCGGGTQSRTVTCKRNDGMLVADRFCEAAKPALSQSCNTHSCYSYGWQTGSWGACSTPCGGGSQSRTVWCRRSDGSTVADSYCSGAKPSTSQYCNNGACNWSTGVWGSWSTTCGSATRTRTVQCTAPYGNRASDSLCSGTKPGTSESRVQCTGSSCSSGAYNETAYLNNKLKEFKSKYGFVKDAALCRSWGYNVGDNASAWTVYDLRESMRCTKETPYSHFSKYSAIESVCGHANCTCCAQQGRFYCA